MSLPTKSQIHVDQPLTNISVAYIQNATHFVSNMAFPMVPVMKQSDKYYKYNRGDFNRDQAEKRAPGTESAGSGFRLSTDNYYCDVWAIHDDVADQDRANQDDPLSLDDDAAVWVANQLMVRKERQFVTDFMSASVWDNDFAGVASSPISTETIQWSDDTSGDPIGDIRDAKATVLGNSGFEPNTLTLGYDVFVALQDHPDIVDRVKYSGGVGNNNPARVSAETMAQLFELDRVLVSKAVYNSAEEGATEASQFIVGKKALLTYVPPSPGIRVASAGYTFVWRGFLGQMNDVGFATKRFRMDHLESDRIEGQTAFDMKVVSSELGYFWDTIVA